MNLKLLLFFFVGLIQSTVFCQSILKGQVISDISNLEGIIVINASSNKTTGTQKEGYFSILAKPTDTLLFSGNQTTGLKIILKKEDFAENLFLVRLKREIIQLNEVVIKKHNTINALSLGIISKKPKSYTPAQRRLRTATAPFAELSSGTSMGGAVGLDPILNVISGRTKMLKKELLVENKERRQESLTNRFEEDFYTVKLKIPLEYINGFQYFVVEDNEFIGILKSKNEFLIRFKLMELAEKYKSIVFQ
ncbi:hypothetical protein [Flavobacterium sp.]|uniref:hypothetical protein n=1 Tax=Flavobacterium sp. TaxID=239 RepID=UPI00286E28DF|nr:hypothetical protein [Flavobacterium sp.]